MTLIPSEFVYDNMVEPLDIDYPVYLGPNPGLKESHISIVDTFGEANPKWLRDTYRIQILGKFQQSEYPQGYKTMLKIRDSILGKQEQSGDDANWIRFLIENGPQFIGVDDRGLNMFTMNFEITSEPFEGDHRQSL